MLGIEVKKMNKTCFLPKGRKGDTHTKWASTSSRHGGRRRGDSRCASPGRRREFPEASGWQLEGKEGMGGSSNCKQFGPGGSGGETGQQAEGESQLRRELHLGQQCHPNALPCAPLQLSLLKGAITVLDLVVPLAKQQLLGGKGEVHGHGCWQ